MSEPIIESMVFKSLVGLDWKYNFQNCFVLAKEKNKTFWGNLSKFLFQFPNLGTKIIDYT